MGQDPGPACLETLVQASQGYSPGVCQDNVTSQAHGREDPSSMLTYVAVDQNQFLWDCWMGDLLFLCESCCWRLPFGSVPSGSPAPLNAVLFLPHQPSLFPPGRMVISPSYLHSSWKRLGVGRLHAVSLTSSSSRWDGVRVSFSP